jgi:predicted glycosyltransferase
MKPKIWIDIEEPKTGIMFESLIHRFEKQGMILFITARDYDSTHQILDNLKINYQAVGRHGGEKVEDKLRSYVERLNKLLPLIIKFKPDYFVTFSSVEGSRISYGLRIPSIGYNDEPRNEPVCKLIFPLLDKIITPNCVPEELYLRLYADKHKLIRYNGIDEIAWLSHYKPNPKILERLDIQKGNFVLIRSEPTFASYFINKLKAEESLISDFLPPIIKKFPNLQYMVLVRTEKQEKFLNNRLRHFVDNNIIQINRFLPNITDLCFYSRLVISGGGTIVRESSLLNVPSIEFFPGDTAPQEQFLISYGLPLFHIKEPSQIIDKALTILSKKPNSMRYNLSFKKTIEKFENPNDICFNIVNEYLN